MLILCCRCCSPGEDACIHSFGLNLLSRARSARCPCPCLASTLHSPSTGPVCCHGSKVPYALLHGTGTLVTHLHLHLRSGPPYPTTDLSVSVICDLSSSSSSSSSVHFSTTTFTPTTSQSHKHNVSQPLRLQARGPSRPWKPPGTHSQRRRSLSSSAHPATSHRRRLSQPPLPSTSRVTSPRTSTSLATPGPVSDQAEPLADPP
jgi:hypothetical protein